MSARNDELFVRGGCVRAHHGSPTGFPAVVRAHHGWSSTWVGAEEAHQPERKSCFGTGEEHQTLPDRSPRRCCTSSWLPDEFLRRSARASAGKEQLVRR